MAGRFQDVILRGTRALQPLATTVCSGTQYYVTDEFKTERASDTATGLGGVWEDTSDSGGASAGILKVATTTWTNADIIGLPSLATGLELVAAPGGTDLLLFSYAHLWWNTTAGLYGNVDAAAFAGIGLDVQDVASLLGDDTAPVGGRIKDVLIGAQIAQTILTPRFVFDAVGWGQLGRSVGSAGSLINKPLYFYMDNGVSGNLTLGNAANTLRIDTYYMQVTI